MSTLTESPAARIATPGPGAPLDGRSHVVGERAPPLRHTTIPDALRETVSRHGQRNAVVLPKEGRTLSYDDLDREVDALAAGLLALGLGKGDRIGIWSPNRLEWILTQFATARFGAILVNINPAYRPVELEYALNAVGCKALVTAEAFKSSRYIDMLRELAPELERCEPGRLESSTLPHLETVIAMSDDPGPGIFRFDDAIRLGGPAEMSRLDSMTGSLSPDDPINIQFTSGTTGSPKGATLTHRNIVNNARFVTDRIRLTERDALCIPVPLYHCFGMVMGVLGCVTQGAAMVFPGEGFDAAETLYAVSEARCTALYGVPTMFVAMLEEAGKGGYDLSSLRTGVMAGASCPIEVMQRVLDELNMTEVTICYGMTETSPVSFQSFVDDPIEKRVTTVGRVHPHLEVKIVDADGAVVPVGESGRAVHARLLGDARLLERRRADRREHCRRLDALRRPGDTRRGRLLLHRGAGEGHDHPRRRERLSARDRGLPLPPSLTSARPRCSASRTGGSASRSAPGSCPAKAPGWRPGTWSVSAPAGSRITRCRSMCVSLTSCR